MQGLFSPSKSTTKVILTSARVLNIAFLLSPLTRTAVYAAHSQAAACSREKVGAYPCGTYDVKVTL